MRLVQLGTLIFSTFFISISCQRLNSTCEGGNLVIDIPYPDQRTAKLLYLKAGDCDQSNYGGSFAYDAVKSAAKVTIPIDKCNMRGALYDTAVTSRSFYRPTANITFGDKINGMDLIYRNMNIAAECGKRTRYQVGFNYTDIGSTDKDGCVEVDGACVFPAYEDDVKLVINEYTDDTYTKLVDDTTRAKLAGKNIYLSMRAETITDNYKFAVTDCYIITKDGSKFLLMEPGASSGSATCGMEGIGLTGSYSGSYFNFQHVLFLLNHHDHASVSSFRLECTAEICAKNSLDSKCNAAALPCLKTNAEKVLYMCDNLCGVGVNCAIASDVPVCDGALAVNTTAAATTTAATTTTVV